MYVKIDGAKFENFAKKKVILFGASSTGMKAVEEFEKIHAHILGFCDNNPEKKGSMFKGYPVYLPDDIKRMIQQDNSIIVLITSTYEKEISGQLKEMGIFHFYTVHMGVLHDTIPWENFTNKILEKEEANLLIREKLLSDSPFFIGRIGSTELETICNYRYFTKREQGSNIPYTNNITQMLCDWCGFFPAEHVLIDQFCQMYIEKMQKADFLWCMWQSRFENKLFQECCPEMQLTKYDDTGFPFNEKKPWTTALKGKKVLVIHPFEQSIRKNYENREKLFANPEFLPEFELITLKAIQTLADNKQVAYKNWFEALENMQVQMKNIDFDIALIGAGAYGFPLGAYAKEIGKKALHIGGMLQLYFGIRGKYYDQFGYHNDFWTRPLKSERPNGYQKVEAGRYW